MHNETTQESQYNICLDLRDKYGLTQLGLMSNQVYHDDPRRLTFLLSRYKFVSKMLDGLEHVLEVGCADAFGTRLVQQAVGKVTAIDFDPVFVRNAQERMNEEWPFEVFVHNMLAGPVPGGPFDGVYALDVLEHIKPEDEDTFLGNMFEPLKEHGVAIIGMPSLESQAYASPPSKAGHVNCQSGPQFKETMQRYFYNVFVFSMNDEVVHTGYYPMAHYLLALCTGKKG